MLKQAHSFLLAWFGIEHSYPRVASILGVDLIYSMNARRPTKYYSAFYTPISYRSIDNTARDISESSIANSRSRNAYL